MKGHERIALAQRIRDAAIEIVARTGRLAPPEVASPGSPAIAARGSLEILHTTPFTGVRGMPAPYGIDIWRKGGRKVFSAWWEPFEIVAMKDGEAILRELLEDA